MACHAMLQNATLDLTCTAMTAATGAAGARKSPDAAKGSEHGALTAMAFRAACTRAPAAYDLAVLVCCLAWLFSSPLLLGSSPACTATLPSQSRPCATACLHVNIPAPVGPMRRSGRGYVTPDCQQHANVECMNLLQQSTSLQCNAAVVTWQRSWPDRHLVYGGSSD